MLFSLFLYSFIFNVPYFFKLKKKEIERNVLKFIVPEMLIGRKLNHYELLKSNLNVFFKTLQNKSALKKVQYIFVIANYRR